MAVIKAVSSKAGIGQALDYVTKEEKTEDKLVSGLHCEPDTVKDEMQATKELWGKTGGRTYKHFVHSYHEDEHITPEQAHKNAIELAKGTEAWKGHEVLIATHIDRGHIHTHFIVNSVNFEDGHKLQWSKADLQNLKDRCNEQSRQQGLHVPEKGKTFTTVFTAVRSEAFVSDFKTFFMVIWQFIVNAFQLLLKGGQWASQLGDKIPQPVVATIVHYLLLIVFVGGIAIGVGFLIFLGASKVFEFYTEDYADTMSLAVFLISLAVSVYFAEPIRAVIPINLLLLLILVHIVYVLIRWYVKGCMRSRGYY